MVIFLDKSLIPGKIMAAGLVSMNRGPCFIQAGGEMRTKNLVKVTCLLNISQLGPLLKLEPRYFISEVSQLVCCTLAQVLLWAGGEMRTKHPGRHHTQDAQGRPYHAPYLNHTCRKQLLKLCWSRKWLRATVSTLSHPENLGARSKPCLTKNIYVSFVMDGTCAALDLRLCNVGL